MALPYPVLSCMSRPRCAALRLAAGHSSGAAAAHGVRRQRRGQGVAAGGGVRPGWRRKKGFYSSYPLALLSQALHQNCMTLAQSGREWQDGLHFSHHPLCCWWPRPDICGRQAALFECGIEIAHTEPQFFGEIA